MVIYVLSYFTKVFVQAGLSKWCRCRSDAADITKKKKKKKKKEQQTKLYKGEHFFSFRVDSFSEGRQNNFESVAFPNATFSCTCFYTPSSYHIIRLRECFYVSNQSNKFANFSRLSPTQATCSNGFSNLERWRFNVMNWRTHVSTQGYM